MRTIGIKYLQKNPAILTKSFGAHEYSVITKHSKLVVFDDAILTYGLKKALLVDAYRNGSLFLGQFSKLLKISKKETLKMLSLMGINVIDYNFAEDLKNLDSF